jgi:hypothetical protein
LSGGRLFHYFRRWHNSKRPLLLPTATNSVVSSVPQGDSGMGSATKRRGAPGRRRARGGGDRQCGFNPIPGSHDGCPRRPAPASLCDPYHLGYARRSPRCGPRCGWRHWSLAGWRRSCGVHERFGGLVLSGNDRRPIWASSSSLHTCLRVPPRQAKRQTPEGQMWQRALNPPPVPPSTGHSPDY